MEADASDMISVDVPRGSPAEMASFLQEAVRRAMAPRGGPGVRHVHNVSLMLERPVVFGSDRLFLWPIRVPPGTAALTVEGTVIRQMDEYATPVLLVRTGGRVPTTENFDAAQAFLAPLGESAGEARAAAAAAAADARRRAQDAHANATEVEDAAAAAATAAIEAEMDAAASGRGGPRPRAAVRVVLKGIADTVFAGVWGGRALFSNTYPHASHTRDLSVKLAARAEVCSPPTAPSEGGCVRVGSGVFLLPGASGDHKVADLSGGVAWTFTLVGAVPGLETSPDRAVTAFIVPRFTSAMTVTLSRWGDASGAHLTVRLLSEMCVSGAAGAEDGEGLDRPVTMTSACSSEGWEVTTVKTEGPGETRSVTVLLPRSGRWTAVASLTGPTEDLDPNPVTAAVTLTTYTVARSAASGAGVLFSDAERTLAAPAGSKAPDTGGKPPKGGAAEGKETLQGQARAEAERRWRVAEAAAQAARASGRPSPTWPFSLDAGTTATQGLTQDFAAPSDSAAMFKLTKAGGDVATIADLRRAASDKGTSGGSSARLRQLGAASEDPAPAVAPTDVTWSMHSLTMPDWSGSAFLSLRLLLNSSMLRPATATADHPGCRPLRVFLRRAAMPLAYHLDVPGRARVAAEDAGGRGAPVIAPADYSLAPENARVVKAVGAGFTELVWEVERPPPGEWFAAIVHSAAGTDLVCEDVLSATDQAIVEDSRTAEADLASGEDEGEDEDGAHPEARGDGGAVHGHSGEPAGAAATDTDADVVAASTFSDGTGASAAAPTRPGSHDGGRPAVRAGAKPPSLLQVRSRSARARSAAVARATAAALSASASASGVRGPADLRGAVRLPSGGPALLQHSARSPMVMGVPSIANAAASAPGRSHPSEPSPVVPDTTPLVRTGAVPTGSASSSGGDAPPTGIAAIQRTLSSELGEIVSLAEQYLSELGLPTQGADEDEARRSGAGRYNPADRLYAVSATLTACSAHCSGECTLLRSEGFVAGQCVCTNPYRFAGDYCDEETGSVAAYSLATALLVVSNAAMIPAVLLALRWHLWGEAVVLAGAALSSALYHTCDQYLFCFSSTYHSLQAMDISGSYLAVAVTVMLLAGLPQTVRLALAIALLAVFLFTLDNPASLGRAVGLALTVAVAASSLVLGLVYSVLRSFTAWSRAAAKQAQLDGAGARGAVAGDSHDDDGPAGFDGDVLAAAFVGEEEEPDSGAGAAFEEPDAVTAMTGTAAGAAAGSRGGRPARGPSGRKRRVTPCLALFRSPACCCGLLGCCCPDCCDPANWACSVFAAARFIAFVDDASRGWVAPSLARRSPRVARAAGLTTGSLLAMTSGDAGRGDYYDDDGTLSSFGTRSVADPAREASAEAMERALPTDDGVRSRAAAASAGQAAGAGADGEDVTESGSDDGAEGAEPADDAGEGAALLAGPTGGGAADSGAGGEDASAPLLPGRPHSAEDPELGALPAGPGGRRHARPASTATPSPISAPQAAPAWCTGRARRAVWAAGRMVLVDAGNIRWRWVYTGLGLFAAALALAVFSSNDAYWVTHSLWHCCIMAVPAALILARVDPRGPLLAFHADARRKSGGY